MGDPLDSLWQQLSQSIADQDHKAALQAADTILGQQPKDEDAYRAKLAALLQLSDWEKALQLISKSTGAGGSLQFEKAYCLYRMGKIEEALSTVSSLLPGGAGAEKDGGQHTQQALELAAQLQHRLGRSKECIQLYDMLFQQHKVGYNKACALVELGDFVAAELELKLAIKLGRETLFEEELTEKEVEEELAPLTVQLAYVLGRLGRVSEAQELHDKVIQLGGGSTEDLGAEHTRALAANNAFADGRRVDSLPAHKKSVAGAAKKLEAMLADASKLQQQAQVLPHWTGVHLLPLLQAAIACKEDKAQEADALLGQAVAAHGYAPHSMVHLLLAQAQLALESGDARKGADLLSKAASVSKEAGQAGGLGPRGGSPALLATTSLLESMLPAWTSSPDSLLSTTGVSWCLEGLADLKLRLGKVQEAEAVLLRLQSLGVNSAPVLKLQARLLRVLASTDPSKPTGLARGLPSLAAEVRGMDVDALEENTLLSARRAGGDTEAASAGPAETSGQKRGAAGMEVDGNAEEDGKKRVKKKRTHKRKPRLPKGYDPSQPNGGLPPPDPERWLPKWERSDFKKKKKKSSARDRDTKGGSAQGAGKVDESLDRTKNDGARAKQAPSKPQPPSGKKKGKR
ncbi:hypothetical protein DUNSADRAFT_12643 [Dunaliella salina]|uniref:Signal recognition particle subunit SRP72 n=1 Tax=Dunaliella salina TaxID=3046 RepID=A0ABQ7H3N5_DUNSA|nr:hypothetical protein DUNSADRAFT_12643 [Dunaliella salina]|eukprot:KAF5841478.1 hypothetical protein DUNSADRAFT_12643 [Dunaliella salina]